jgi:galactokinase
MAIARDVVIAVSVTKTPINDGQHTVTISNSNSEKYPNASFTHDISIVGGIDIDSTIHSWSNYFKCGYKAAYESAGPDVQPCSLNILIDGNVPVCVY